LIPPISCWAARTSTSHEHDTHGETPRHRQEHSDKATSCNGFPIPGKGLCASEARLLRFTDVDADAGVLTIRDGKGGKDRQVPVSPPLRVRLADYHARVAGRTGGDWFFPGTAGRPLTLANIGKNFRRFLWQARIPHGGKGHGPRVHDLRHVFAVNNLRSWFARGEDAGAMLPVLQAYMGHSSIAGTGYYLRLTAESYPHIAAAIQHAFGDIVPALSAGAPDGD
jgi:integrase/recombinase XerD